ncbi:unnamed protein product [Ceratitis capitata]|uniref:(Mediterranean fruit fly) hypothetical protein n=1 Tax=Ceratitis capitata TaxID=7213 RepID=A0A811U6T4_CERCA|nr:unnamed protein product [Ceratitis capitata]
MELLLPVPFAARERCLVPRPLSSSTMANNEAEASRKRNYTKQQAFVCVANRMVLPRSAQLNCTLAQNDESFLFP